MEPWRSNTRLPLMLGALGRSEEDAAVRRLTDAFGGAPTSARQRLVGEPGVCSRRLLFESGGELILHDGAVAAVLLHLVAPAAGPRQIELSEWIPGVDNSATLDDLGTAIGAPRHFAGFGTPYFTLDGGYARTNFRDRRGWNDPGTLLSITVTIGQPGLVLQPEDDDCPTCSDLLVRGTDGKMDVAATVTALAEALAAGRLSEDAHWVRLADLQPLQSSGLLDRVESQLTCATCRRIVCLTLLRDSTPTFGYFVTNDAMRRSLGPIPPVERWGDEARITQERAGMRYVDHEPAAWFLVEKEEVLYLEARYSITSMLDDSALIRLDDAEVEAYRARGHDFVSALARRIHESSPHRENSPFYERDLFRGPGNRARRDEVAAAIVNHTWIAQQRDR